MAFQPRMQNHIEGFSVLGGLRRRYWNGITADLWDVECANYAGGHYVARDPRLFILLEHRGAGRPMVRRKAGEKGILQDSHLSPISYIPADVELWVDIKNVQYVRHLDIHFDVDTMNRRLGDDLDPQRLRECRLSFADSRIVTLSHLIATELANPEPLHDLYGDGLALSLLIDVLKLNRSEPRKRGALSPWQLRRALDFIEEHCLRNIRLEELATITGLSQSHFSHSFKAATGVAPHEWQMNARLDRAKHLLKSGRYMLTTIAAETGFADHAHFSRTFRKHVGVTPSQWKKSHSE
ncbi:MULTISPECIES: AraC family transcriptional regulator [Agrobacterium]|uniref:AraC family transcriptional regulator n=1 Tax=Agrobacterium rosae TaxID=1972867 RepID=A0AAE5VND6_9HYPH|nr:MULTISPECIES: AraC family transcriptional regulator [Agrobacterium]KAA3515565.1 AraC family transcriptional regulator [Agrobacterium rosae]KAA3524529.1 AraC family transcriptional regulator [Agrobacterium rosae]MBN7804158.1 helix-turn-helix transcriptional regulator [Agrobacterium rosae]MCM2431449.1 helix-turn-helix transcriptional regulator [Agrobacterium rosae]MDX8302416.1 AraC family transcriptional regulator [Agrobacterium rosae]